MTRKEEGEYTWAGPTNRPAGTAHGRGGLWRFGPGRRPSPARRAAHGRIGRKRRDATRSLRRAGPIRSLASPRQVGLGWGDDGHRPHSVPLSAGGNVLYPMLNSAMGWRVESVAQTQPSLMYECNCRAEGLVLVKSSKETACLLNLLLLTIQMT